MSQFKQSTPCFLCGEDLFEYVIWCITKTGLWKETPVCPGCDSHITKDWIHSIPGVEVRLWPNGIYGITLEIGE